MRVKIEQSLREKVTVSVNSGELENTIAQNLIRDEICSIKTYLDHGTKAEDLVAVVINKKHYLNT